MRLPAVAQRERHRRIQHSFIEVRFTRSGIRAEPGLGRGIVELAGNLPYDVQRLAHETWDEVRSGGSYISQSDLRLHFGLERRAKVDLIEVRWPSGAVDRVTDAGVNRILTVREGQGLVGGARCFLTATTRW